MPHYRSNSLSLPHLVQSVVLALSLIAPCLASADTYYVASVAGGSFQVVSEAAASESTPIDHSQRGFSTVANDAFNKQILQSLRLEVLRVEPKAEVMGIRINDPSILPANDDYDDADSVKRFAQALTTGMTLEPRTKLLIMVPWRSRVLMQHDSTERTGMRVAGFGFYMDHDVITDDSNLAQDVQSGFATKGALAVFANVSLVLIDLNEGTVLNTQSYRSSDFYPASRSPSLDIMESATQQEQLHSLTALVQRSVTKMVPTLLKLKGSVDVKRID